MQARRNPKHRNRSSYEHDLSETNDYEVLLRHAIEAPWRKARVQFDFAGPRDPAAVLRSR